jgi:hypothetical protein
VGCPDVQCVRLIFRHRVLMLFVGFLGVLGYFLFAFRGGVRAGDPGAYRRGQPLPKRGGSDGTSSAGERDLAGRGYYDGRGGRG